MKLGSCVVVIELISGSIDEVISATVVEINMSGVIVGREVSNDVVVSRDGVGSTDVVISVEVLGSTTGVEEDSLVIWGMMLEEVSGAIVQIYRLCGVLVIVVCVVTMLEEVFDVPVLIKAGYGGR